jgi:hypothetical protein
MINKIVTAVIGDVGAGGSISSLSGYVTGDAVDDVLVIWAVLNAMERFVPEFEG